ncbi:MAG: hemerythrin domain-containing protein [Proteobacteria bacterium]|nr:hemerythrin domain-containing protein [Pseudomonadota bacterium]
MDIFTLIRRDYEQIRPLLEAMPNARRQQRREELFNEIKQLVVAHMECKKAVFYPNIKGQPDTVELARHDIAEILVYLNRLTRIPVESEKWLEVFSDFQQALERHWQQEEGAIFPKAHAQLNEAEAKNLGEKIHLLKKQYMTHVAA